MNVTQRVRKRQNSHLLQVTLNYLLSCIIYYEHEQNKNAFRATSQRGNEQQNRFVPIILIYMQVSMMQLTK